MQLYLLADKLISVCKHSNRKLKFHLPLTNLLYWANLHNTSNELWKKPLFFKQKIKTEDTWYSWEWNLNEGFYFKYVIWTEMVLVYNFLWQFFYVFLFQEYPLFTMTSFPPGFIIHIGGVVAARSIKLLDKIHNPGSYIPVHVHCSINHCINFVVSIFSLDFKGI
jgi:hypothetical protein